MSYAQDISACFGGDTGLDEATFARRLARCVPALEHVRARHKAGDPLYALPGTSDDLDALEAVAERYRGFEDILILATGGSSLGGQAICALADSAGSPRLHFLDNIDPEHFDAVIGRLDFQRTGVLVISKSGGTPETLVQFLAVLPRLIDVSADDRLGSQVLAITGPGDTPLRRLALRYGCKVHDHDPDLGGRFAALSLVGLLPALIAGLDARALRAGASDVLDSALATDDPSLVPPAVGATLNVCLARERQVSQTVLLPYSDRLKPFALWFRQLWAESLGKDGQGTTPLPAVGAVDQHSQLQLWLDGPSDKLFTLILADRKGQGAALSPALAPDLMDGDGALSWLAGRSMGDLMEAEQRATAETLAKAGRPVRILGIGRLDEKALGALMMHYMLETVIAGHLFGVDPFGQPAVEEGKILARRYLSEMSRGT
ncbi:MAG: glucose-6-phosphate isomerase [Alphaproteobacteria bacterium]|nr:glucose-6-phosphate isomerase [Alphaproteobacteria bacterium]